MAASKVYFTDMRVSGNETVPGKMIRLAKKAGLDQMDFEGKFVAIKVHFGEEGNLAFLRPDYARALVEYIKSRGGKPFVSDSSTLYVGARKNALDHLDVAFKHGYNPFQLGCHTIIADGVKGTDEAIVEIDGEYVKHAKIGRAFVDADVIISLNHFKGHEGTGFGGALKNLGMGCGSSAGKAEMHEDEKPTANPEKCVGCGVCARNCAHDAVEMVDKKAHVNYDKCKGCGRCIGVCPTGAMKPSAENGTELLSRRVSEYAYAVCKDKPNFHINMVIDISPSAIAIPTTTRPSCRISACSLPSTPWPWTRPAWTRSTNSPSSTIPCWACSGSKSWAGIISIPCIRTPVGKPASTRARRSAWAARNTSW